VPKEAYMRLVSKEALVLCQRPMLLCQTYCTLRMPKEAYIVCQKRTVLCAKRGLYASCVNRDPCFVTTEAYVWCQKRPMSSAKRGLYAFRVKRGPWCVSTEAIVVYQKGPTSCVRGEYLIMDNNSILVMITPTHD